MQAEYFAGDGCIKGEDVRIVVSLLVMFFALNAMDSAKLEKLAGRMVLIGFDGTHLEQNSTIIQDINHYNLAGVILFDKDFHHRKKAKNITSPTQFKQLTHNLQKFSNELILIGIDQEGGKVARLKPQYGFTPIPSAQKVATLTTPEAQKIYEHQSAMLEEMGINLNFSPVVDLARNPKNRVIVGLERSFGKDPRKVAQLAHIVMQTQQRHHIISALKHFPGHGSSLGDSHKGFVDVTQTWDSIELQPYKLLLDDIPMIMSAHVFNAKLDSKYPATLSYKITTELLRKKMGYKGVVISDDMQMGALSQHYSLDERVRLAINAGVDILLFGNQLEHNTPAEIVHSIVKQVKSGAIPLKRLVESNKRIEYLLTKNSIHSKPIKFTQLRKNLTKAYIKKHYGKSVQDITIVPQMIVLHWTAVTNFKDSFDRLYGEKLWSDRKDIASASLLNVSAHFLVDRDGTIYQLMPDNWMARHVIGLNYSAIGVENVGGRANKDEDLTPAQLRANIRLVEYLKMKYPTIKYVIGHYEYRDFEHTPLWLEKDSSYRTVKVDPGEKFMHAMREVIDAH